MRMFENFDLFGNLRYNKNDAIFVTSVILIEILFGLSILYVLL